MKSIRLSLLLYFLGLLALAIGTASVLAYQTAQRTLEEKKAATQELIEAQYQERCRQEERRLDESLRLQAEGLAKMVRIHIKFTGFRSKPEYLLGLLSSSLAPSGYVLAPTWLAEAIPFIPRISLREDDFSDHEQKERVDYFQVDTPWTGSSYHSASLSSDRFPLDRKGFAPDKMLHSEIDKVTLPSGKVVRRLVLKTSSAPNVRYQNLPGAGRPRGGRGGVASTDQPAKPAPQRPEPGAKPNSPPAEPRPEPRLFHPPLYIHCAFDIGRYKKSDNLDEFAQRRDEELAKLDWATGDSQASLLKRLVLIASLTFLAALTGSFWLVRRCLTPLARLSEAVSKVSPRNFRLPVEDAQLPTEVRPIVQRLKETLELLKRAFGREKQATADISHELRTPLAVLLTTTELGLRKPRTVEQYRELLQDCRFSAQQMNEIIQRLLTLARLDAGVDQLHRRPIDLSQLAEQCASLVRPLAEARGLTLNYQRAPALPVQVDADKLREVLNNLLHNAVQYNRPNGRIDISVAQQRDQLCMEVRDTGIGISPEARPQIFERFYRADPSRGGDDLHAGLGLALVKEYVDLMGGRIDVESAEGQGSTFRVWLPA